MQELRILELEENIRRKDLTEYEKNKAMVEYIEVVKEELADSSATMVGEYQSRPGGQIRADSQENVAERTGVPASTARRAQNHVETADAFPFMQSWPQYLVIGT